MSQPSLPPPPPLPHALDPRASLTEASRMRELPLSEKDTSGAPARKPHARIVEDDTSLNIPATAKESKKVFEKQTKGSKDGRWKWPTSLEWIPKNWTASKWKPVIRSALSAWVAVVLFIIGPIQQAMGQASFIILVASFLSPPSDPFIAVLEREFFILFFVTIAWAWSCLGIKLANLARSEYIYTATPATIFTGQYIEAAPAVIMAVFLFIGAAFFLYIKARKGPGPFIFATVFACICLDISLTTAAFFPYPYYTIGQSIIIPLCLHSGLSLFFSLTVFPRTISSQFTTQLSAVLAPLQTALTSHMALLSSPPSGDDGVMHVPSSVAPAEAALIPLLDSARLLGRDTIYARGGPQDLLVLHDPIRRLAVRAHGMSEYFRLGAEAFPRSAAPSAATSRVHSRAPSRAPGSRARSPERDIGDEPLTVGSKKHQERTHSATEDGTVNQHVHFFGRLHHRRPGAHTHTHHHHSGAESIGRHPALHRRALHDALFHHAAWHQPPPAVGVYEASRAIASEARRRGRPYTRFTTQSESTFDPPSSAAADSPTISRGVTTRWVDEEEDKQFERQGRDLLAESTKELLESCVKGLEAAQTWLAGLRVGRITEILGLRKKDRAERRKKRGEAIREARDQLYRAKEAFKKDKRLSVLSPYRSADDAAKVKSPFEDEAPPHRHLFHCYYYQYHLVRFSCNLLDILEGMEKIENERPNSRLWLPGQGLKSLFKRLLSSSQAVGDGGDDENPDVVQGVEPEWEENMDPLGRTTRRDPDALPPRNMFELILNFVYLELAALGRGNALFAVKAGALTILLCLPLYIKSSAQFAYDNRFVWGIFMGQLTLARWRGETAFGLVARVLSTFFGGIVGMLVWYISAGDGMGNAYGLAAVCAVVFPFFFYGRLYWPGHPMTNIIFFVTTALVFGYSWQDTHFPPAGAPGYGWEVAWKRFVLVVVGVAAAFLFALLPPSTTLRRYQRASLATTAGELGTLYCTIVSFASNNAHGNLEPHRKRHTEEIVRSLIAVRAKLKRSSFLMTNVGYEISPRGRWPIDAYKTVLSLQLEAAYMLSHLMSAIEQLEPHWSRAFLRRTRFLDPEFQGTLLAVISMINTALRTGQPLPQITPCPLLDRFMENSRGLAVDIADADASGAPSMSVLEDYQYMTFCVAATTAFNIVARIDRLMVAVKELVGEQYHISGLERSWEIIGMNP